MDRPSESNSIKNWSEDDRPREKMLHKGRLALSDAELLAILIGSGSRNESAVDLCKRILKDVHHQLNDLGRLSLAQLMQYKGIGEAKAITIAAALELGRRRQASDAPEKIKITSSQDAFNLVQPTLADLDHEEFWILLLNRSNRVIRRENLSKGGIHATVVDQRIAFRKAIEVGASALILCHNHPSGTLQPSESDIQLTNKFKKAGEHIDIQVLDHLIIGTKGYYSFADNGII